MHAFFATHVMSRTDRYINVQCFLCAYWRQINDNSIMFYVMIGVDKLSNKFVLYKILLDNLFSLLVDKNRCILMNIILLTAICIFCPSVSIFKASQHQIVNPAICFEKGKTYYVTLRFGLYQPPDDTPIANILIDSVSQQFWRIVKSITLVIYHLLSTEKSCYDLYTGTPVRWYVNILIIVFLAIGK